MLVESRKTDYKSVLQYVAKGCNFQIFKFSNLQIIKSSNHQIFKSSNLNIVLPISKSIANRLLILGRDAVSGIPACDLPHDVAVMQRALMYQPSMADTVTVDIEDCGTAMRFLTAYFAVMPSNVQLTGTDRMKQRPIAPLVDALRQLGADIQYAEKEGFPPLVIKGRYLKGGVAHIRGDVSSQFVSALMLVSHLTEYGITVNILPPVVSSPYIRLTQAVIDDPMFPLEADWSSAAFWYEYAAINGKKPVHLLDLSFDSLQPDSVAVQLFEQLGVVSEPTECGIMLQPTGNVCKSLEWDFTGCPDLYPAVVATCHALNIDTHFSGLQTLRLKESDRIEAMSQGLKQISEFRIQNSDFNPQPSTFTFSQPSTLNSQLLSTLNNSQPSTLNPQQLSTLNSQLSTYSDHRIVMALAMINAAKGLPLPQSLLHSEAVTKSYPHFWKDLEENY